MPTIRRDGREVPDGMKAGIGSVAAPEVIEDWIVCWRIWQELAERRVPIHQRKLMIAERTGLTRRQVKRRVTNFRKAKEAGNI